MDDLTKERYPEGPTWREGRGPKYKGLSIAMDDWGTILDRRRILNEALAPVKTPGVSERDQRSDVSHPRTTVAA
jgi:hypothetical protein